ncbi:hypothetical protein L2E82_22906 [Cichorium intybus]|uniref:Uncharacterized protein n=1 Tax=Cichorium intybus TaxID=13427 RepID=A0ACB9DZ24_CICIN|nr:hypothetical protein L2E82_22906 [Cichorium intybus]
MVEGGRRWKHSHRLQWLKAEEGGEKLAILWKKGDRVTRVDGGSGGDSYKFRSGGGFRVRKRAILQVADGGVEREVDTVAIRVWDLYTLAIRVPCSGLHQMVVLS